ncbi:hypothetical protein [Nocardia arthritidis]|uniref:Hemophore-related protein n=1 Tax=Nocardia arthritidis TaxID=228602 RepID=A0A6G9YGQ6_9NOCA|nr:hypothetical protein [Nocardia arthritidis]QIS12364.1 hypothetical protein F5544_22510 [Nocardia arthritidis]
MRRTILTTMTLVAVVGGWTAVAGPASAVSDEVTCKAVSDAAIKAHKLGRGIDNMADFKALLADEATKFAEAAANADEGAVKTALYAAVAQLNRVATASDSDLDGVIEDPAFQSSLDAVPKACGL